MASLAQGASKQPNTSNLESTITRLLVCTKSLLEGLAKWSRREVTEDDISAIYVKLGNDFNVACAVFARENISMNELLSVPSDLRVCLETCLSDSPSQATLERHLPQVRQIIIGLLHGLREKQRLYRDGVQARRALTPDSATRSKDDLRRFVSNASAQQAATTTTRPPSNVGSTRTSRGGSLRESSSSSRSSRTAHNGSDGGGGFFSHPSSSSTSTSSSSAPSLPPLSNLPPLPRTASDASITSTASSVRPPQDPDRVSQRRRSPPPPPPSDDPIPRTPTLDQFPLPFSVPVPYPNGPSSVPTITARPPSVLDRSDVAQPPPQHQVTAASLEALKASDHLSRRASKRYSAYAIQKMTSPVGRAGTGDGGGGPSNTPSDGLAASPSSMRINSTRSRNESATKVVGTSTVGVDAPRRRTGGGAETGEHRSHRSIGGNGPLPPIPAIPRSYSSQADLSSRGAHSPITEEEGEFGTSPAPSPSLASAQRAGPATFLPPAILTSTGTLSRTTSTTSLAPSESSVITHSHPMAGALPAAGGAAAAFPCQIFLQIGRDVKKARVSTGPPTVESLRQLFVERFQYNPGISGWPEIYVRDPDAGVSYELEDMSEVVAGSVLSLNIDTVEQVKQHIDHGLTSLAQDIKELRTHVFSIRRASVSVNSINGLQSPGGGPHGSSATLLSPTIELGGGGGGGPASLSSPSLRPSPSEAQFHNAAQRVIRSKRLGSVVDAGGTTGDDGSRTGERDESTATTTGLTEKAKEEVEDKLVDDDDDKDEDARRKRNDSAAAATATAVPTTPMTPTTPTGSVASSSSKTHEVVATLKHQHAEVQHLRRELGVLRQVYVDFVRDTKDQFGQVRVHTSRVHHLAATKLSTERQFVEAGTHRLELDSTQLVVQVDELQDLVDQLREDTVKGVRPRLSDLSDLASRLRTADERRRGLVEWLQGVKPTWSLTWSHELSKILGEQKAVETQETLLVELADDLDDVQGVFNKIQAVAKQLRPGTTTTTTTTTATSNPSTLGGGRNLREVVGVGRGGAGGGGGDSQEGLSTVLLEVKALQPDPQKRLEAIAKAERQREQQLQNKTDEFQDELGEFVGLGKLRKSGGIEETERLRQARSEATLKAMFSG